MQMKSTSTMERSSLNRILFLYTTILISIFVLVKESNAGLYIPKREYLVYVDDQAYRTPGKVIGVIALSQHSVIECDISNDPIFESNLVTVRLEEKKLVLYQGSSPLPTGFHVPTWFEITLACSPTDGKPLLPYYEDLLRTEVTLLRASSLNPYGDGDAQAHNNQDLLDAICPYGVYDIIENAEVGIALDFFLDPKLWLNRIAKFEVNITSNEEFISMRQDGPGTLLTLAFSPNREQTSSLKAVLTCRVRFNGSTDDYMMDVEVTAEVYDVNDSPPTVSTKGLEQLKEHLVGPEETEKKLFTMDGDSMGVNNYTVSTNDSQAIRIGDTKFIADQFAMTYVSFNDANITRPYYIEVYVDDLTYRPVAGENSYPNRVVHRFTLQGDPPPKHELVETQLDKAATQFSLITNLRDEEEDVNVTFVLLWSELTGLMNVTPNGHLYLIDPQLMWETNDTKIKLDVGRFSADGRKLNEIAIIASVTNTHGRGEATVCDHSCSSHNNSETCKASCGIGTASGLCTWNFRQERISTNQSPCSPDISTCPDGYCDELESLHPAICPQDCGPVAPPKSPHTHIGASTSSEKSRSVFNCGHKCRITIAAAGAAMTLVTALVLFTWLFHRRRENKRRHISALKRSSSVGSVGAIPSDYIVDESHGPSMRGEVRGHRQITTSSSPSSGQWGSPDTTTSDLFDDNWEFPRRDLTLENILGEGEFGQVVKAQAKNLKGLGSNAVVAVKMLKPEASGTEYQDLASEFQLMKEVDHPNVIKLLGVCSQKGPLYLIVEYCELGSLRSFLRASQFKNKGSWDEKKRRLDDENGEDGDIREITIRDLFAFAWQIAKGMDYLSGLKIVHRDLAARNVLVTEGLKLKISDFGLSRDVYEMDTYLKMSKGRIPVKWMAPESLYGQVYTTKSDIWSYGIVLWETVTLGASPYPGIPPERLFPLLSTGYRMDKPEECPDELYAIMQKCWKSEPEQRPTFAELVRFLDNILQQNTGYLDLSGEHYMDQSSGFDFESKDFLMSLDTDNEKLQHETPPPSPINNNQHKSYSFDGKAHTYRNLQLLNSDPDLSVTPIIEDIAKVKQEPPSCYTEENEEGLNESEPETESSRLLNPDVNELTKGHDLIIPSDGFGSSLKATTCKQDQNQSHNKIDTTRPRVHENLTYV